MRTLLLPAAVVVAGAALLALSACAGASPSTSPSAGSGSSSAPASSPAKPASTGPVDVCGKIPVATIASLTGRTVYTTAHTITGPFDGAKIYACEYTDSKDAGDALDGLNLVVYRGGSSSKIMADLAKAQTDAPHPQSGIGDSAQLGAGEIDIVTGGNVVVVSDSVHEGQLSDLNESQLETLARKVMALL